MNTESLLNEKALDVFVILAETLAGWKNPMTEEGKPVLLEHYTWASALKASGKLILAGPTDVELISTGKINPLGRTTGIIMIKAESREEAERWAFKDPFHIHGFRKNAVYSMKISMTEHSLFQHLDKVITLTH